MRNLFIKGSLKIILFLISGIILFILAMNYLVMPWYVSGEEVSVPKVIGLREIQAKEILSDNNLDPIIGGERFNDNVPKGSVIFQKPQAGSVVKEGRRVFIFISSGVPSVKVPPLKGKALRDAKLTLERIDLVIGDTTLAESEEPKGIIIDQEYYEGTEVKRGTKINITISSGINEGMVTVPDFLGMSLSQAEKLLENNKLVLGRINYQPSFSLLPNTVIDQYPAKKSMVDEGSSIDLFVTKNVDTPEEVEK